VQIVAFSIARPVIREKNAAVHDNQELIVPTMCGLLAFSTARRSFMINIVLPD
jgi:hypothetical protein